MKNPTCIVVFDDEQSATWPFGFNPECKGAIEVYSENVPVAVFPNRAAARKAIKISRQFALLQKAQGVPANTDFIEAISYVKIIPATVL